MKNRISVSEVAELMNVSEQFIRIGLQKGIFPFGYAVKMSTQWTYYISPQKIHRTHRNHCVIERRTLWKVIKFLNLIGHAGDFNMK